MILLTAANNVFKLDGKEIRNMHVCLWVILV